MLVVTLMNSGTLTRSSGVPRDAFLDLGCFQGKQFQDTRKEQSGRKRRDEDA